MNAERSELIAKARDENYRGCLQHLRSWSDIDSLLMALADELEEAERRIFVYETLRESAPT